MKRIESCELNEIVRPVMDGWWSDGGPSQMWQSREYHVRQFHLDEDRPRAPHSFVRLRDNLGLGYCLNYGRFVIGRLEAAPSLGDLAAMPPGFWASGDGECRENSLNRTWFKSLLSKVEEESGKKVVPTIPRKPQKSGKRIVVNMDRALSARHFTPQALACLSLVAKAGGPEGIAPDALATFLRENASSLASSRDPYRIFMGYKSAFLKEGLISEV